MSNQSGADPLRTAFEKSQEKMNITEDEATKFRKAFDDPEFRKLFADYMDEMQDPNHRQETEDYIRQLEGEDKVPSGKQLIRPSASFVVKTKKISTQVDGDVEKVFINIVNSDKIQVPNRTVSKEGSHWSIPYSVGPPHMERDKKNENAVCFDCCFHPEAIQLGSNQKQFKDLLIQTAMEGVETAYKRQRQDVKLSREYHILKGVQYKQGTISSMLIDLAAKSSTWENIADDKSISTKPPDGGDVVEDKKKEAESHATTSRQTPQQSADPALSSTATGSFGDSHSDVDAVKARAQSEPTAVFKKGFLTAASQSVSKTAAGGKIVEMPAASPSSNPPSTRNKQPAVRELSTDVAKETASVAAVDSTGKAETPKYTKTERGVVSMGDFESLRSKVASNRPKEIVYRIELPKMNKASSLQLDVAERQLKLSYLDIYDLTIALPYPVFDKKGSAKYDKSSKTLTVCLPVQPPTAGELAITEPVPESDDVGDDNDDADGAVDRSQDEDRAVVESDDTLKRAEKHQAKSASSPVSANVTGSAADKLLKASSSKAQHSRWVGGEAGEAERVRSEELRREIKEQADAAVLAAKEAAKCQPAPDRKTSASAAAPATAATTHTLSSISASPSSDSGVQSEEFVSSKTYKGARPGYFFGKGIHGLGYYIDRRQKRTATATATADNTQPDSHASKPAAAAAAAAAVVEPLTTIANEAANPLGAEKVECDQLSEFQFDFRQTTAAIPLLVQVPNILAETVRIDYAKRSLDVRFQTIREHSDCEDDDSAAVAVPKKYGMRFALKVDIDPSKCTHDVASKNMVIGIAKRANADSSDEPDILVGSKLSSPVGASSTKKTHPAVAAVPSEKVTPNVEKYRKQIESMSLRNDTLFELD